MKKGFNLLLLTSTLLISSCTATVNIKSQRLDSSKELLKTNAIDVFVQSEPQYKQLLEFVLMQELEKEFNKRNIHFGNIKVITQNSTDKKDSLSTLINEFGAPVVFKLVQKNTGLSTELMYIPNFEYPAAGTYSSYYRFKSEFDLELFDKRLDASIWKAQVLFKRDLGERMEKDVIELSRSIIDRLIIDGIIYGAPRERYE